VLGPDPEWLAWSAAFFDGFTAEQLIATVIVAVLWLYPGAGVAFINIIKEWLGIENDLAHKAVLMILMVFAVVVMLVTGAFTGEFTFANLIYFFGEAYLLSQYAYKHLTAKV
jgi:hypothetical protein